MEPMLEPFAEVAEGLEYRRPGLPIVSCLTGEVVDPARIADPKHWIAHARRAVRFADAVASLDAAGVTTYLEVGPDPVLCAMVAECLADGEPIVASIPTLRADRPELEALTRSLAAAHVAGATIEWERFFAGSGAKAVPLPTYPFQRRRHRFGSAATRGDLAGAGLEDTDHPLLVARMEDPEGESLVFTGTVSVERQPWLADHVIFDTVILPGTGFAELALKAAQETGARRVEELTLEAPLTLPEGGAATVRVSVSAAVEEGGRDLAIHSRPAGKGGDWKRHATGRLAAGPGAAPEPLEAWPPEGAEPLEVDSFYERIGESGLQLGPAFQRLGAAWRLGDEYFAEVSLAPAERAEGGRFAIHPVLLDAALHTAILAVRDADGRLAVEPRLPFSWRDLDLMPRSVGDCRVRVRFEGELEIGLDLADGDGRPLGRVGSLALRPVSAEQLRAGDRERGLLGVEWSPVPLDASTEVSVRTSTLAAEPGPDPAVAARLTAARALAAVQGELAEASEERLAVLTRGAVAAGEGEAPDPALAAAWGLVRSAISEHPGRFCLIDSDGSDASERALPAALAAAAEEPQLALREGVALAPRLSVRGAGRSGEGRALDTERTVLITGAGGGLASPIARHLVAAHGARRLLLASRSGPDAEGAEELRAELGQLGADVRIVACDVSDRARLARLLESIAPEHPLGAVVHAAGLLADGTVASLDAEAIETVFAPKADAAWHLHELTAGADLSAFVLCSSAAATLGAPGQGNYAAANAFLDALARGRRAEGLPATSIAWGPWS